MVRSGPGESPQRAKAPHGSLPISDVDGHPTPTPEQVRRAANAFGIQIVQYRAPARRALTADIEFLHGGRSRRRTLARRITRRIGPLVRRSRPAPSAGRRPRGRRPGALTIRDWLSLRHPWADRDGAGDE